jgi:outer membrane protein assembly factor BamB
VYWAGSDGNGAPKVYKINAKNGSTANEDNGWTADLSSIGGEICNASPSVADGKVFISTYGGFGATDAVHIALNDSDGSVLWQNGDLQGTGQCVISYDSTTQTIFVPTFDGTDHYISALKAADGTLLWQTEKLAHVPYCIATTFKDNKLYVNTYDFGGPGAIYVFDTQNSGATLWSAVLKGSGDCAPAVDDQGNVYVKDYDWNNSINYTEAFASDGSSLWSSDTCGSWQSGPVVIGQYVLAASQNDMNLKVLNASNGELVSTLEGNGAVSVGNKSFFVVDKDGKLRAYSLEGLLLSRKQYTEQLYTGNNYLQQVNPASLNLKWQFDPKSDSSLITTFFANAPTPCVSADGSMIYTYGNLPAAEDGTVVNRAMITAVNAFTGEKVWNLEVPAFVEYWSWSSLTYKDGYIYWAGSEGDNIPVIEKINAVNGSVKEEDGGWVVSLKAIGGEICNASPTVADGKVFISTYGGFGATDAVHIALKDSNGELLWSNSDGGAGTGAMAYDNVRDCVYQTAFDGTEHYLAAYDAETGTLNWKSNAIAAVPSQNAVTYVNDRIYLTTYSFSGNGILYVFDAADNGKILWQHETFASGDCAPAVDSEGNVCVKSYDWGNSVGHTTMFDKDGNLLWDNDSCGSWQGAVAIVGNYVFSSVQDANETLVLNIEDGSVAAKVAGNGAAGIGQDSLFIVGNDGVLNAYSLINEFADSVVDYVEGTGVGNDYISGEPFNNPATALGRPTVDSTGEDWSIPESTAVPVVDVYPVFRAFEIVTVGTDGSLILEFDHNIENDPDNPYGVDFIVYGNAYQEIGGGAMWDNGDPNQTTTGGNTVGEPAKVYVSQNGVDWVEFTDGPFADSFCPTFGRVYDEVNPYHPDSNWDWNKWWGKPTDATLPIDPNWTGAVFDGKTVREASEMCGLSAGGTGFDIASVGLDYIKYVKIVSGDGVTPEIDAVADARIDHDSTPCSGVNDLLIVPGNNQVDITWTNPSDDDFRGVVVVRTVNEDASAVSLSDGTAYYADYNSALSTGTVVYNGNAASFTDDVDEPGAYQYAVFAYDKVLNYSSSSVSDTAVYYSLEYTAGDNGTISGEPSQVVLANGSGSAVEAVADEHYHFVEWSDGVTDNPRTDSNISADLDVTANFAIDTFTVTFDLGEHGTRTGGGELVQTVEYGTDAVAPEFDVEAGWTFTGWDSDFTGVTEDITVTALYEVQAFTVTFELGEHGTRVGGGELVQTVEYGSAAAAPEVESAEGWSFTGWDTDFSSVVSDMTVNAEYEQLFTISGTVSGVIAEGVTVLLSDDEGNIAETTTDADGNYLFAEIAGGIYTVTPELAEYVFDPVNIEVNVDNNNIEDIDFTSDYMNRRPVADDDNYTVTVNTELSIPAPGVMNNDSDPDNDSLTAVLVGQPEHGTLEFKEDGSFIYSPDSDYTGNDAFSYKVSDGSNESNTAVVTLIVINEDENNIPVAINDEYSVVSGDTLEVSVLDGVLQNDVDNDNDSLNAELLNDVKHGSLEFNENGSFTYIPDDGFDGVDSFSYQLSDGTDTSNEAAVMITVLPEGSNSAPVAVDDDYQTVTGEPLSVPGSGILANDMDADGDSLSAVLVSSVSHGDLELNSDGSFLYIPENGFVGTDSFTYRTSDGNAESNTATVSIAVTMKKITVGMIYDVYAEDVEGIGTPASFVKNPKIYGLLPNGKKASLKKMKDAFTPLHAAGVWNKKVTLYDKKAVKGNYAGYIDNNPNAQPAQQVDIMVKTKTESGEKVDGKAGTAMIVPPLFTSMEGAPSMGATITVNGLYFGGKTPKVALEDPTTGKLIKAKVVKEFTHTDYKGKPSCMCASTGLSSIKVVLPSKNLTPGMTYPLIIDNKIGIAVDENGRIPRVTIK